MKRTTLIISFLMSCFVANAFASSNDENEFYNTVGSKKWLHGEQNCKKQQENPLDILQVNKTTYILRQNKCLTFEAPFIYVLIGENKVLVLDSGAIDDKNEMPLVDTLKTIIGVNKNNEFNKPVVVAHSHKHSDHYKGDALFEDIKNVTVIGKTKAHVTTFFKILDWNNTNGELELGSRKLTIIPTPGHQSEAITIYDPTTNWLLTGDSFYPGLIYIKNWQAYKNSIRKMVSFSRSHNVSGLLGAHIEMSNKPTQLYDIGSTYQPNEAQLNLNLKDLIKLNKKLQSNKEQELIFDKFIIQPMNFIQKSLTNIVGFFKG